MDTRTIWAERVAITNVTRRPLGKRGRGARRDLPRRRRPGADMAAAGRLLRSGDVTDRRPGDAILWRRIRADIEWASDRWHRDSVR